MDGEETLIYHIYCNTISEVCKYKILLEEKDDKMHCPVCGNIVETYDVCKVCNWENTGFINIYCGPNETYIIVCSQRKHKYGIIPCHDGTIWKYETSDNISLIKYSVAYDKFRKSNYTRLEEYIK